LGNVLECTSHANVHQQKGWNAVLLNTVPLHCTYSIHLSPLLSDLSDVVSSQVSRQLMSEQAWGIDEGVKDVSSHSRPSCPSLTQA